MNDDLLAQIGGDQGSRIVVGAGEAPPPAAEARPPAALLPPGAPEGPLTGAQWSGYRLGALLGAGGMGVVYRAWQRGTGRLVAFKVLSGEAAGDPALRARFANEARAAAAIDAPQVVRVLDAGEHQGRLWLAMELVEGRTLAEELRLRQAAEHPFAPLAAAALAQQAALGLAAAHALRLVHRDIKPANLMLAADGQLKVADFGLVRRLDGHTLTRTGTMIGTPLYAAPEQGRGLATDARGDVYSLGAVLYELLTLRPPFHAESAEGLVFQHNYAEPPLPATLNPAVPAELQAVCLRCLQKDPARRFADGAALAADLARIGQGLAPLGPGLGGRPSTGAEEALRRLAGWRRRWWPVAGAALLLAALA
ncbi:MAG: serine/threonine protein kinase, partial [Planctomycetes bacterium]|nr:serine/threonine protein kinase [Planctomycetota bacterium]